MSKSPMLAEQRFHKVLGDTGLFTGFYVKSCEIIRDDGELISQFSKHFIKIICDIIIK
jgi:hypothetical protein